MFKDALEVKQFYLKEATRFAELAEKFLWDSLTTDTLAKRIRDTEFVLTEEYDSEVEKHKAKNQITIMNYDATAFCRMKCTYKNMCALISPTRNALVFNRSELDKANEKLSKKDRRTIYTAWETVDNLMNGFVALQFANDVTGKNNPFEIDNTDLDDFMKHIFLEKGALDYSDFVNIYYSQTEPIYANLDENTTQRLLVLGEYEEYVDSLGVIGDEKKFRQVKKQVVRFKKKVAK